MDIRDNLKAIIAENGYIQAAIARKAGLTPAKLSGILNKSRKLEANEMLALCAALKIDPLYLIRYHEEEPANPP